MPSVVGCNCDVHYTCLYSCSYLYTEEGCHVLVVKFGKAPYAAQENRVASTPCESRLVWCLILTFESVVK
jgi:hypothetical protein